MESWGITLAVVLVIAYLGALALILISVARSTDVSTAGKWVWAAVIVVFPLIGSLAWGLIGPRLTKVAEPGLMRGPRR